MKVSVEFLKASEQKTSEKVPLSISLWKLGPIGNLPYIAMIKERHDIGMSPAWGDRLQGSHQREVWITSREVGQKGGYVQPCGYQGCWDQRRFGSQLYVTESREGKKGWNLTLVEVIP